MRSKERKHQEDPQVTAACAALVSMGLCSGVFIILALLFGVAEGTLLFCLFFVVRGHRLTGALACKWTGHVMNDVVVEEVAPRATSSTTEKRTRQILVIDHDPNEFRRS
jgi:hypothetical protein